MLRILLTAIVIANLAGCAGLVRDRRDAPWDPKPGQSLFDQIPNWDDSALRICGGHLDEETRRREGRSPRC